MHLPFCVVWACVTGGLLHSVCVWYAPLSRPLELWVVLPPTWWRSSKGRGGVGCGQSYSIYTICETPHRPYASKTVCVCFPCAWDYPGESVGQVDLPAICQLKGVVHVPVLVATVMSYKKKNRRNISKLPNIGFPDLKSQFYFVVVLNKC